METNHVGGGYALRQNILTTSHAPGSIHRSASRRKNNPINLPVGISQPDFGAVTLPSDSNFDIDPFTADTSIGQFDDPSSANDSYLAGGETVIPHLGPFNEDDLELMCMPAVLSPDSQSGSASLHPPSPAPLHPPGLPLPASLRSTSLQTPDRPTSSFSPAVAGPANYHSPTEVHTSLSPPLRVGRIPNDRKAMMEACFSQIQSLLDQAAQHTNRSRAQVFSLFANTQTVKRAGRTVWNIYESYFYEDPAREQKRAGIPGADCKTCWTSFKTNPQHQEFLLAFDEAKNLADAKSTLQERTRKFKQYTTQLESLVENNQRNGFETIVVTVGNAIHSDASLCNVITSAGAEGFFESRLKVNDQDITGILKNHVCNLISMDFETHVAAHLQEEIAQVKGKSTANRKHNKKSKSKSNVNDDDDDDDGLDVAPPCVDDATDGDYVAESDDDSVEDVGFRTFTQVREAIMAAFWALLQPFGIKKRASMPWTTLVSTLCSAGLSMTGYPQVPFPGEVIDDVSTKGKRKRQDTAKQGDATKQGIKDIGTVNARILLHAFQAGNIQLVVTDKTAMKSGNAPVITEGPPPHDSAAPRGRRLFFSGNIDRNGPARLKAPIKVENSPPAPAVARRTRKTSEKIENDLDSDNAPIVSKKVAGKQRKRDRTPLEAVREIAVPALVVDAPGPSKSKPQPRPIRKSKGASTSESSALSSLSSSSSATTLLVPAITILASTPAHNTSTRLSPAPSVQVPPPATNELQMPRALTALETREDRVTSAPNRRDPTAAPTPAASGRSAASVPKQFLSGPGGERHPINEPAYRATRARMSPPAEHLPPLNDPSWEWCEEPLPVGPSAFGPRPPVVKRRSDIAGAEESPSKKAKTSSTNTVEPERTRSVSQEHGAYISRNVEPASEFKQDADNHGSHRQHSRPPASHYSHAPPNYNQPPVSVPPSNYDQAASALPSQQPPSAHPSSYNHPPAASAPPSNYNQPPVASAPPSNYNQTPAASAPPCNYNQPQAVSFPSNYNQAPPASAPPSSYNQPPPTSAPSNYNQAPPSNYNQAPPPSAPASTYSQAPPASEPPINYNHAPPPSAPPANYNHAPPPPNYNQGPVAFAHPSNYNQGPPASIPPSNYNQGPPASIPPSNYNQAPHYNQAPLASVPHSRYNHSVPVSAPPSNHYQAPPPSAPPSNYNQTPPPSVPPSNYSQPPLAANYNLSSYHQPPPASAPAYNQGPPPAPSYSTRPQSYRTGTAGYREPTPQEDLHNRGAVRGNTPFGAPPQTYNRDATPSSHPCPPHPSDEGARPSSTHPPADAYPQMHLPSHDQTQHSEPTASGSGTRADNRAQGGG